MQRGLRVVLVVLLIASAGCTSGGEQTTAPTEDTSASGATLADTSSTVTPQFPPGVSEAGVENVSAILTAHKSHLQNRSFTAKINTTGLTANGSIDSESMGTLQVGGPGEGTRIQHESKRGPGSREIWYNNSTYFVAITDPGLSSSSALATSNNTTYLSRGSKQRSSYQSIYSDLENASVGENTTTSRVTRNGRNLVRIQGLTWNDTESQKTSVLSLLVGSQGVIWNYTSNTTYPARDTQSNTTYRIYNIQITSVNESAGPEPPAWVPTAANRTDPIVPASTTPENRSG